MAEQLLKALIVDDEYAARETMCRLVDWSHFGFAPPVTAANGQKALELYRAAPFELVFTDIEMPVMNGISMIEEIRRLNPAQRVAVISCHEKFEYAYKALKLGVEDYFIKDLLTEKELTAFLSSFALEQTAALPGASEEDSLCRQLREAVTTGACSGEAPLPFEAATVLVVLLDDYDQMVRDSSEDEVSGAVSAFVAKTQAPALYYPGSNTLTLVFEAERNPSTLFYYNQIITLSNTVRTAAGLFGLKSVSIGISNLCTGIAQLPEACRQALEAAQMRVLVGAGRTTIFDTIVLRKSALDFRQMEYLLGCIDDYSRNSNTACLRLVDKLYAAQLPTSFADIHYYNHINSRLWTLVLSVCKSQGRESQTVLDAVGASENILYELKQGSEMAEFFKACLLNLFAGEEPPEHDNLVYRALRLIEEEYAKDISLDSIAQKLHTNKSYLSRQFKKQTGDNLMNHLIKKKIKRAEYLLQNTNMKLYEISDSLSFASPQYFSTVFKRYTGVSPNEYKKNAADGY